MEKYCEKIKTYLDNSFASFPQDEATMRMKNDIYCSMLDKFNELVNNGASKDEAFGKVIGDFGSLDEIRATMDINPAVANTPMSISPERKTAYDKFKIKQGVMIAIGVVLCIFAVFGYETYALIFKNLSSAMFGLLVALAVFIFVFAGTIEAKYFDVTNPVKYIVVPTAERVAAYQKFLSLRAFLISLAVFLFVTSGLVIPLFAWWYVGILLPIFVAVGVAILIITGVMHDTYKDVSGRN